MSYSDVPMTIIKRLTFAEANQREDFKALVKRYSDTSKADGIPDADLQSPAYEHMERANVLRGYGAFSGDLLVGIIATLVVVMPRHGKPVATVEAFYVEPEHRKSGTAKQLLDAAQEDARASGAVIFSMTAPVGSRLERAAPFLGLKKSYSVFSKVFE